MAARQDSDWWSRLDEVFQGALDLPAAERRAYLDRTCAHEPDLRAEVEAMLDAEALAIERLVPDALPREPESDPFIGVRLGPWRVLEPIGRGGMGVVYLAERADGQYEQRVALKIVRSSPRDTTGSRFKAETRILARLSHPNIARLLDAGFTPEGSAYLVMEYVDGSAITEHCDAHQLTIEERLRLFLTAARATQHAHQSLVVHRDLKPSNIFVSRSGEVKLLDFGIAKLLEADHPVAEETSPEWRALTPAYAAPEQLRGEAVTTAADVYVLGSVLYELLTGSRPSRRAADPATGMPIDDLPAAPSVSIRRRLRTDETTLIRIATVRRTSPSRLARRLDGDIDRVVLKALQPEPERRYGSAGQLADDIERLLEGRPVEAQPDSLWYRARRFVGRHRLAASVAAVASVTILVFGVLALLQARAAAIERDRARLQADRAERAARLVADLFSLAEPGVAVGQEITARQLLDRGKARITAELAGDPVTQAELFNVVGRLYNNLSLHDEAIDVLNRALTLVRAGGLSEPLVGAETLHWLGELHVKTNEYDAAERYFRDALRLRRESGAPEGDVAATLEALGRGLSFAGRHADARESLEQAAAIRRRHPEDPAALMSVLNELALTLHRLGDMAGGEALFREAAVVGQRVAGPSPEKVSGLLHHARLVHRFDRNPQAAEPIFREALAMARAILPDDHQQTATILTELARDVRELGRLPEAESLARESREMFARLYGVRHRETMIASQTLASILRAQDKLKDAETLYREALETANALFGAGHPMSLGAMRSLASILEEQKQFVEARVLRERELADAMTARPGEMYVALALSGLGTHGLATGDFDLAERSFVRALDLRRQLHPPDDPRIADARAMLGAARLRAGRYEEAEPELLAAYEASLAARGPSARETLQLQRQLADLYERWNRPEQARRYRSSR